MYQIKRVSCIDAREPVVLYETPCPIDVVRVYTRLNAARYRGMSEAERELVPTQVFLDPYPIIIERTHL